jgi:hypothetical protein
MGGCMSNAAETNSAMLKSTLEMPLHTDTQVLIGCSLDAMPVMVTIEFDHSQNIGVNIDMPV